MLTLSTIFLSRYLSSGFKGEARKGKDPKEKVICLLMLDEIAIKKKQIDFDGGWWWCYVDCGIDLQNSEVQLASETIVIIIVSQNADGKLLIF